MGYELELELRTCMYCSGRAETECFLCETPICLDDSIPQGPWRLCPECMGIRP
jgi:hypothetical protein